jgi:hypothetical protein
MHGRAALGRQDERDGETLGAGRRMHIYRMTLRGSLLIVASSALILAASRAALFVRQCLSQRPYVAHHVVSNEWSLNGGGLVSVELFHGTIEVFPAQSNTVAAQLDAVATSKRSQGKADAALGALSVKMNCVGESITIVSRSGRNVVGAGAHTDLRLWVPAGISLRLRTGRGDIRIGRGYSGSTSIHCPVAASSIEAWNESPRRLGYAEGNITVETVAPPSLSATKLRLEAVGRIEIRADSALVSVSTYRAKVPGDRPPRPQASDERDPECGTIHFFGSLSAGESRFEAAQAIQVHLSPGASFTADAESTNGQITSEYASRAPVRKGERTTWRELVGADPKSAVFLRSTIGPIVIRKIIED